MGRSVRNPLKAFLNWTGNPKTQHLGLQLSIVSAVIEEKEGQEQLETLMEGKRCEVKNGEEAKMQSEREKNKGFGLFLVGVLVSGVLKWVIERD